MKRIVCSIKELRQKKQQASFPALNRSAYLTQGVGKRNHGCTELLETKTTSFSSSSSSSSSCSSKVSRSLLNCVARAYDPELQSKSIEELQQYAVKKSEDTTASLNNCLKVAEEIKGSATMTLEALHGQRVQIGQMHETAVYVDQNLSAGEKLLGSLGGMFSRTWKPKRSPAIKGPISLHTDDISKSRSQQQEQAAGLGIVPNRHNTRISSSDGSRVDLTPQSKLEMEREKQDDALTSLSSALGEMKEMSLGIGAEISRQMMALDHFQSDIIVLDDKVQGANTRACRLLGGK